MREGAPHDREQSGASRAPPDAGARVVALTGARSFLGTELIKRLEEDPHCARVLALDIRRPEVALEKTEYVPVDLTLPTADAEVAQLLADRGVDTLVHAAFLSYPTHATEWAHELEDIGTMHVLNACAQVAPARLLLVSTTLLYGAAASNPNFLSEEAPLAEHKDFPFLRDKVAAELQVQRFARQHPATRITILRFAPMLGPTVANWFTRFFSRPVAPVMMGYDPLLQFLHERDAIDALKLALEIDAQGVFNIVGKGVLPYTTVLALMGKFPLPLPHLLARPVLQALWATQVFDVPPSLVDFFRFLCVADGSKAARELRFTARYPIKRTVLDFLGVGAEDGAPEVARAQG